jgi:hypothetical protein
LAQCGGGRADAQRRYRHCVDEGVTDPSPWEARHGQSVLGPATCVAGRRPRRTATRRLPEDPRVQRDADRPSFTTLCRDSQGLPKAARERWISTAHVDYGHALAAIGRVLELHYTTISKVVQAQMV